MQNRRATVTSKDGVEALGDGTKHLVPTGRLEAARALGSYPPQWTRQAYVRIAPDSVVADRAFGAQRAPADVVVWIAHDIDGAVCRNLHHDSAGVVAVPRAGCADRGGASHRPSPRDAPMYRAGEVPPIPNEFRAQSGRTQTAIEQMFR